MLRPASLFTFYILQLWLMFAMSTSNLYSQYSSIPLATWGCFLNSVFLIENRIPLFLFVRVWETWWEILLTKWWRTRRCLAQTFRKFLRWCLDLSTTKTSRMLSQFCQMIMQRPNNNEDIEEWFVLQNDKTEIPCFLLTAFEVTSSFLILLLLFLVFFSSSSSY